MKTNLQKILIKWESWSSNAEKNEDGWESLFPNWTDLIKQAIILMGKRNLSEDEIRLLEKCWSISEEDEEMIDACSENVSLYRENLHKLSKSIDPKVRWQVFDTLKNGSNEDEPIVELGINDEDNYCKRRALISLGHLNLVHAKEVAKNFLDDKDEYLKNLAIELVNKN